ncbi:MAG: ABC transporter ATP-binding protein [Dongiaceae bacterium]
MPDIRLEGITKRFGGQGAVDNLSMTFAEGTVTCLLGPSGCGKTTLMRMIAGLETPSAGRILFGTRDVTQLPPRKRNIGMVFQYPVMYPTLTVRENIALPLENNASLGEAERRKRIDEVLQILQLTSLAGRYIDQLDAGTRQKVAVARAVARQTDIILFDEPTTNVEVTSKLLLVRAFKEVAQRMRQTIVYVTHDQTEAMTLADQIALMRDGKIVQCDGPRELYNHPTTEFGGWFLGSPGMNFITGRVSNGRIAAPLFPAPIAAPAGLPDGEVTLGLRPEALRLHAAPGPATVPVEVQSVSITIGGRYLFRLGMGGISVKVKRAGGDGFGESLARGGTAHLECPPAMIAFFSQGQRLGAEGQRL